MVLSVSTDAWTMARASHAPARSSSQPARGVTNFTLLHFPHQPPVVPAYSAASQTASSAIFSTAVIVFVFVCMFLWAFLLFPSPLVYPCLGVWVLVTQYTFEITFNGDPGFVASVPRANGPASSEALPPRTFVLSFNFGLPRSSCCVFSFLL